MAYVEPFKFGELSSSTLEITIRAKSDIHATTIVMDNQSRNRESADFRENVSGKDVVQVSTTDSWEPGLRREGFIGARQRNRVDSVKQFFAVIQNVIQFTDASIFKGLDALLKKLIGADDLSQGREGSLPILTETSYLKDLRKRAVSKRNYRKKFASKKFNSLRDPPHRKYTEQREHRDGFWIV